jgi:hypothetical protein
MVRVRERVDAGAYGFVGCYTYMISRLPHQQTTCAQVAHGALDVERGEAQGAGELAQMHGLSSPVQIQHDVQFFIRIHLLTQERLQLFVELIKHRNPRRPNQPARQRERICPAIVPQLRLGSNQANSPVDRVHGNVPE